MSIWMLAVAPVFPIRKTGASGESGTTAKDMGCFPIRHRLSHLIKFPRMQKKERT